MPVFTSSDQLYSVLTSLFNRITLSHPEVVQSVSNTKLLMRLRTTNPSTEVNFNSRLNPMQISYGPSTLRPDVELELPSDMLHQILLGQLSGKRAIASGRFKMRGPIWKTFVFEEIFHAGQSIYPEVLRDLQVDGSLQ